MWKESHVYATHIATKKKTLLVLIFKEKKKEKIELFVNFKDLPENNVEINNNSLLFYCG